LANFSDYAASFSRSFWAGSFR